MAENPHLYILPDKCHGDVEVQSRLFDIVKDIIVPNISLVFLEGVQRFVKNQTHLDDLIKLGLAQINPDSGWPYWKEQISKAKLWGNHFYCIERLYFEYISPPPIIGGIETPESMRGYDILLNIRRSSKRALDLLCTDFPRILEQYQEFFRTQDVEQYMKAVTFYRAQPDNFIQQKIASFGVRKAFSIIQDYIVRREFVDKIDSSNIDRYKSLSLEIQSFINKLSEGNYGYDNLAEKDETAKKTRRDLDKDVLDYMYPFTKQAKRSCLIIGEGHVPHIQHQAKKYDDLVINVIST
ncbi:MAG: hypothetical protein ABII01_02510 [Candidatus Woesearchaeota archaeon]